MSDLSDDELRYGTEMAKDFNDYFTFPVFRQACKLTQAHYGLVSVKQAYVEACMKPSPWSEQQWSHAAVLQAALETGQFALHSGTEREVFPLFKLNYEKMCARVLAGENLDMPVQKALSETVPHPTTPEVAKVKIAGLKDLLAD